MTGVHVLVMFVGYCVVRMFDQSRSGEGEGGEWG